MVIAREVFIACAINSTCTVLFRTGTGSVILTIEKYILSFSQHCNV